MSPDARRFKGAFGWLWGAAVMLGGAAQASASAANTPSGTSIFAPLSSHARSIYQLSLLVLAITGAIFAVVFGLLVYALWRFRERPGDHAVEPPQIYGSEQVEIAWTVVPVLIVVVLGLTTARTIQEIQNLPKPPGALEVTVIGRQWWWEFRYPSLGIVTANELHVPVSDPRHPRPTFLRLLSADVAHSFWVPRLAGKTDLIPNRVNHTWIDPEKPGLYLGQCAEYCGTQHAKMLLRVYVHEAEEFDRWAAGQKKLARHVAEPGAIPGPTDTAALRHIASDEPAVTVGRRVFQTTACINCHDVNGTVADGRFGPDLTHLMSRDTLASGAVKNTPENLRAWIKAPDDVKPGVHMPAMMLDDRDLDALMAYLVTLQ